MRIKHLPFLLYVADCWAESPTYILVSHPDYSKPHLTSPTKGRNKSCRSGNCLTNKKREFCNYKIPALLLYYILPSPEFLNSPLLIKKFYPQLHFVTHTGSHNSFLFYLFPHPHLYASFFGNNCALSHLKICGRGVWKS